ncbi:MAG TPA: hypothetical protein VG476_03645 [Acidimicrobiales bacterium]|nr:hypothetical protein [Acidimicrobiales bacterium]
MPATRPGRSSPRGGTGAGLALRGDAAGITRALHADNPSSPDVRTGLAHGHPGEGQR